MSASVILEPSKEEVQAAELAKVHADLSIMADYRERARARGEYRTVENFNRPLDRLLELRPELKDSK